MLRKSDAAKLRVTAGKVDPEKEQPEDPTVDPFDPGEDILGSPIKFTVEVSEWEDAGAQDITM